MCETIRRCMVEAEDDGINIAGDVSSVGLPQRGIRGEAFGIAAPGEESDTELDARCCGELVIHVDASAVAC